MNHLVKESENIMGNMFYCMFENTLNDLRYCQNRMGDDNIPESESEIRARLQLIQTCHEIADNYDQK